MALNNLLFDYQPKPGVWDEMYDLNVIRGHYQLFLKSLENDSLIDLAKKNELAKKLFMSQGITFTVYSDGEGIEKIFPFDILPRIISATEWAIIERGIKQRVKALNIFLGDVYHDQFIIKDGKIPASLINSCPNYLKEMVGVKVPHTEFTHTFQVST